MKLTTFDLSQHPQEMMIHAQKCYILALHFLPNETLESARRNMISNTSNIAFQ